MALSGNENNVALLRHHAGCAYSLAAVDDGDNLLHLLRVESGKHIVDDVLWLLKTWVVAGYNHLVALLYSLLCHKRTLALVAVAAGTAYGDDVSLAVEHLVYGVEHILQGIRCVGIVYHGGVALRRVYRLKTSAYAVQGAHNDEHILRRLAKHNGCAIYREQVAYVELANELYANLVSVHLKVHSLEVALDDASLEVGYRACRVGLDSGLGVLHHHHAVLVVGIGYGKGGLGQRVEERLFGVAIVLECLVIVEVVACKVGEDATGKGQSANALLCYSVRRALHEGILAASLHHAVEQRVKLYWVRCGVVGGYSLVDDIVAYGRQQAALVAHLRKHII